MHRQKVSIAPTKASEPSWALPIHVQWLGAARRNVPMTNRELMVSALVVFALAGVLHGQKLEVKTHNDPKADFTAIKTYAWLPPAPLVKNVAPDGLTNPDLTQEKLGPHIVAAVNRELAARGLVEGPDDTADVHVVYFAALSTGFNQTYLGEYYGYVTGWASPIAPGYTPSTSSSVFEQGTIVFDMVQRASKRAVWRGSVATRIVQERTLDKRVERINEAVRRIFERFPIRAKK
jgi:Domain of unknown function (DUF4136)